MPINASPEYIAARKEYLAAQTLSQKIEKLKKMISVAPSHKGAENLRKQLTTRLKKFLEKKEKVSKAGGSTQKGIKKEDMQAVIIGKENAGKSTLLSHLTNAHPTISKIPFTTTKPVVGMMPYAKTNIQLVENPAVGSEYYHKGLTHTADTVLILVTNLEQIKEIKSVLKKSKVPGKQIILFNKTIPFDKNERKIKATLNSEKYNHIIISTSNKDNYENLKEKIFQSFDKIRVFTKEPGKEKSSKPIILDPGATVKDVAEKILKGFSKKVKETRIWGPSSKFPNQQVGLKHKLKDKDIVEFKTK
ncbi:TGS domain-containing protein [Candidatus Pacearchaeota archaeon]|nr:TGS domain-containing protein [Candidatus Pacearchaeota archaeon]